MIPATISAPMKPSRGLTLPVALATLTVLSGCTGGSALSGNGPPDSRRTNLTAIGTDRPGCGGTNEALVGNRCIRVDEDF